MCKVMTIVNCDMVMGYLGTDISVCHIHTIYQRNDNTYIHDLYTF